jgi:leucyl aminopeptidase
LPDLPRLRALAEANTLTRLLTLMPPNLLTPGRYRKEVASLVRQQGWQMTTYGLEKLRTLGAGAFVAVAQGSQPADAAIVKLVYDGAGKGRRRDIALVGKGICFDTGGHNLKPARYMSGMHEDVNGSAVVLGILLAATRLKLPLRLTAWLAVAENHLSPEAYTQNAVVTALNGTTIEVVHTDAEGRMVLADTLTLAARAKPDAILDFATLTGSMHTALGARYSGVLSNRPALLAEAVAAGAATGERVCTFPLAADYAPALDSEIADVKQCTLEGEADHILAALFLKRFVDDRPWLHMDLSASRCKDGLGAVASEVTGFGVAWGLEMLARLPPHG